MIRFPSTQHRTSPHLGICLIVGLLATGCNLSINLDEHPYKITLVDQGKDQNTPDLPKDMPPADMGPDLPKDMPKDLPIDIPPDIKKDMPKPVTKLIFTELMIDVPAVNSESTEYIEIANVGNTDINPKKIGIVLDTASRLEISVRIVGEKMGEEEVQFAALDVIKPGEHFVFIRSDITKDITTNLTSGLFYEWRWSNSTIGLINDGPRTLSLIYDFEPMDEVRWFDGQWAGGTMASDAALPVTQNVAFVLSRDKYNDKDNPTSAWCLATKPFGTKGLMGTPGQPSDCK